ncbi:MAG: pantetheine-phosphate adenylyltransferase [Candidatus Zixiibacteriota bacterium]|nr:MAG: pantetheine-phosphate adenylyltransferase [candidate division Zixibacteria bacterium]
MPDGLKALYPGTFDPITLGHIDIIKRARKVFDFLVIAVASNLEKKPLFTDSERVALIRNSLDKLEGIEVTSFDGLTAKFAKSIGATAIVRGIRAFSDFEFEFQMALTNRKLQPDVETVFLTPDEKHSYISSSLVKDIARRGGDITCFVPDAVKIELAKKYPS